MLPWESILTAYGIPVVVAFLAEMAARAWIRWCGRYFVWAPYRSTHQVLDQPSLPRLPPLARFEVNGDGERGDPLPRRDVDCYRGIVLGASSTECRFLDQECTWPAYAQDFLNLPRNLALLQAEQAHLGNLGRSLATCAHLDLILEKVNPGYERMDAVIVMTGSGDVVRWLSEKAPATIPDVPLDLDTIFDEHPEQPFAWTMRGLALRRIASAIRRRFVRSPEILLEAGRGIGRARSLRAKASEIIDSMPDAQAMFDRFEESFRRLLRRAQRSARTVIVVRPCWVRPGSGEEFAELGWMFAAGDLRTEEVRRWYSHRVADRLLDHMDRRIAAIASEMGVPTLDPKLLLDPGFTHFYDETHLAPSGCVIIGEAVAQAVLRERKGRLLSRLRPVETDRHADVA